MSRAIEHHAEPSNETAFLPSSVGAKLKTLLVDYVGFINLLLFFLLIWPVAMLCFGIDRLLKTRLLDAIIRFCELF